MILFFIISFFLYLILGYLISQLFCYKYGISKFSCSKKKVKQNYNNNILNNININKPSDDLISRTDKKSDFDNLSNIEEENIDDDEAVHHNPEKSKKKKELMVMTYDLMNTPETSPAYSKKIEYLKSSLLKDYNPNNKNLQGNRGNHENDFIKNEFETDLDNINELQEIRNRRRQGTKTMYNLNNVEEVINNNLNLSVIKNYLPEQESFLSESIEEMISDSSFISEAKSEKGEENKVKLKKGEYNKIKNDINKDSKLEIIEVQKYYGNEHILDGLSFTLFRNQIFTLLGENGAGKSTLISILSGLIGVSSGCIKYKINEEDIGADITTSAGIERFRKILGVCPQNNNILFEDLTVRENLEMFCLLKYDKKQGIRHKSSNELIEEEVSDLLKQFDLDGDKLAKGLSGGQKRKLSIAIACCGRSEVIILDEPTGGIDIYSRKSIWKILKELKNRNKMILLITHFMDEASFLSDQIGILKKGKIIIQGTNRQLIDNYGKYVSIKINKKLNFKKAQEIADYIKKNYCY